MQTVRPVRHIWPMPGTFKFAGPMKRPTRKYKAEIENKMAFRKGQLVYQIVDVSLFGNGSQRVPPPLKGCSNSAIWGNIATDGMWCQNGPNYAVPNIISKKTKCKQIIFNFKLKYNLFKFFKLLNF